MQPRLYKDHFLALQLRQIHSLPRFFLTMAGCYLALLQLAGCSAVQNSLGADFNPLRMFLPTGSLSELHQPAGAVADTRCLII